MTDDSFGGDFLEAAVRAGAQARVDTLNSGIPVFYVDDETDLDVVEQVDGRRFAIRFIPGAPGDRNYKVLRELKKMTAA